MWVMPRKLSRDLLVGTTAVYFGATNWIKVPAYIALGQFTAFLGQHQLHRDPEQQDAAHDLQVGHGQQKDDDDREDDPQHDGRACTADDRSEEHTPELQSLMRNSYAVVCLK